MKCSFCNDAVAVYVTVVAADRGRDIKKLGHGHMNL